MGYDIETGKVWVPITELLYIGWAKIKTNRHRRQTQTDVITHEYQLSLIYIADALDF